MKQNGNGTIGFTAGLLIGGLLGAAIMLFYPLRGETVIRSVARKKMAGARRVAQKTVRRVRKKSAKLLENAKRTGEGLGKSVIGPNGEVTMRPGAGKHRSR